MGGSWMTLQNDNSFSSLVLIARLRSWMKVGLTVHSQNLTHLPVHMPWYSWSLQSFSSQNKGFHVFTHQIVSSIQMVCSKNPVQHKPDRKALTTH
jgi:hypothetical protein